MRIISAKESGAFIETFAVEPTGSGALDGLTFAVKDLVDVAGYRTGSGNPTRLKTAAPAVVSAVCVDQLLAAGAQCEGKTITDEFAFSLLGENFHYGTPLNAAAPERVPGGSSCGSASAVACGLVDFAIGTDTGGSVRVPASNCGIWGWRSTHGVVSVAGVMPLAPTFDTVGILARDSEVLQRASRALLGVDGKQTASPHMLADENLTTNRFTSLRIVAEAFEVLDEETLAAMEAAVELVAEALGLEPQRISLAELCADDDAAHLKTWADLYRQLTCTEALSCHGTWIADTKPTLGPMTAAAFRLAESIDRSRISEVVARRERYYRALRHTVGANDLLCLPSAPAIAPLKGEHQLDRTSDYYSRTLAIGAISGVGRLPQVSMPLARVGSAPIGLSLVGAQGEDLSLLETAAEIGRAR